MFKKTKHIFRDKTKDPVGGIKAPRPLNENLRKTKITYMINHTCHPDPLAYIFKRTPTEEELDDLVEERVFHIHGAIKTIPKTTNPEENSVAEAIRALLWNLRNCGKLRVFRLLELIIVNASLK